MSAGDEHESAFPLLAAAFEQTGAHAVLVGGYAVSAYHYSRYTHDIDFAVVPDQFPRIADVLAHHGYRVSEKSDLFARVVGPGNRIAYFLFVDPHTMSRLREDGQQTAIGGVSFTVPSVYHMVAMKLHSIKNDRRRRELLDMPDILAMCEKNNVDVRGASFKEMCLRFGDEDLYRTIVDHFHS